VQRIIVSFICSLMALSSASACMTAKPNTALVVERMREVDPVGTVYDLPAPPITLNRAFSDLVRDLTCITHYTLQTAADLPRYASKTPHLALGSCHKAGNVANHGAQQAKHAATQGLSGFNTVTSFLLRIAYYSFSALISGILRS